MLTDQTINMMDLSRFDYHLPDDLIATRPTEKRSDSKLYLVEEHNIVPFKHIVEQLNDNDLLIFNDTKVIPARVFAQKMTGGKVEIFLERILDDKQALVQIRSSKRIQENMTLSLLDDHGVATNSEFVYVKREGEFHVVRYYSEPLDDTPSDQLNSDQFNIEEIFLKYGKMPLPPYIEREAEKSDLERYQTIYAKNSGAVAAPTAGLHFDEDIMLALNNKGIQYDFVTLHVGAGTFQPVRVDDITQHKMHKERFAIKKDTIDKIIDTKRKGGKIVAVGTTTARALETYASEVKNINVSVENNGSTKENNDYYGESQIFIYPGYQFKVIDGLITNFHLPKSTLIMMVCALAGYDKVMQAYDNAIHQKLRFYSYGDAMLLWKSIL